MSTAKDIATQREGGRSLTNGDDSHNMLAVIIAAARDPSVDAGKMETMANLAMRLQDREREAAFNAAKIAAIMEMPAIVKRGKTDKFRFAKFEDLHRAVMPILRHHGLVINFNVGHQGNNITVQPILSHVSGYVERGETMVFPPDTGPGRNAAQAVGSASSYGKRHSLKAMLNIIEDGEDDDGTQGLPSDQMNDAQARMVEQADRERAAGTYAEWFRKLRPRDRAWMISTGRHGEDIAIESKPVVAETTTAKPATRTPEQMVSDYITKLNDDDQTGDLDELLALQTSAAKFIMQMKDRHPELHARIIEANAIRYDELLREGRPVEQAGELFNETDIS